jgi:hypothetical protein
MIFADQPAAASNSLYYFPPLDVGQDLASVIAKAEGASIACRLTLSILKGAIYAISA